MPRPQRKLSDYPRIRTNLLTGGSVLEVMHVQGYLFCSPVELLVGVCECPDDTGYARIMTPFAVVDTKHTYRTMVEFLYPVIKVDDEEDEE